MEKRFQDRVALVTAGAAGIGAATAEAFAHAGARVMMSDINESGGEEVAARLRTGGADVRFMRADATVEEEVERLVRKTVETFGGLHVATNVVGDAHREASGSEFHKQSVESWDWTVAVSLRSVFLSMKYEIAHMIEHGGGTIANVTSLSAMLYVPVAGAAYAAAKAGVIQLTKFAALTYADRGVRVNCIAPGVTPTAAYEKAGPEAAKVVIDMLVQDQAIKRPIAPSEQATGILWLCSDDAAMVTGHILPIDGGWTAR
jgi:NAD(P)-dependent dehydrogenase (short-subunit alcohol dehydrogenase family)